MKELTVEFFNGLFHENIHNHNEVKLNIAGIFGKRYKLRNDSLKISNEAEHKMISFLHGSSEEKYFFQSYRSEKESERYFADEQEDVETFRRNNFSLSRIPSQNIVFKENFIWDGEYGSEDHEFEIHWFKEEKDLLNFMETEKKHHIQTMLSNAFKHYAKLFGDYSSHLSVDEMKSELKRQFSNAAFSKALAHMENDHLLGFAMTLEENNETMGF